MATRTVANGGGNYGATGTWVEGAVPTSADDVVFTATSGNLVINTTAAAKTVNFTNYTGTVSGTSTWTVSGNITLVTGVTFSSTWTMAVNATSTLTSNGKTFNNTFAFSSSSTFTLADNWTFLGAVSFGGASVVNHTSSGVGDITFKGTVATGSVSGTAKFTFDGCSVGTVTIANVMEVNTTSGTFRMTAQLAINGTSFTYIAGNTNTNTSTVKLYGACTINVNGSSTNSVTSSSGINFYNIEAGLGGTGSGVVTLSSNMTCIGTLSNPAGNTTVTINGNTIYCFGHITTNVSSGGGVGASITGTTSIVYLGTGTWSANANSWLGCNLTINTSGTLTVSGTVYFNNATLTYTAGTVVTTSSTLHLFSSSSSAVTLNTDGMTWFNIINGSGSNTLTLNSTLSFSGTFSVCAASLGVTNILTFAGSYGFTGGILGVSYHSTGNINFVAGVTYTATNGINCSWSVKNTGNITFKSTSGGVQAILTVPASATNRVLFVNATDIDSSGGKTIRSLSATLSNATNWVAFTSTDLPTLVSAYAI